MQPPATAWIRSDAVGLGGRAGHDLPSGRYRPGVANVVPDIGPVSVDAGAAFRWRRPCWRLACRYGRPAQSLGQFQRRSARRVDAPWHLAAVAGRAIAQMVDLAAWTGKRYANVTAIRVSTTVYHKLAPALSRSWPMPWGRLWKYVR